MFDSVMRESGAPDLFRIYGGSGSVQLAAGGDPITDYVLDELDELREFDVNGQRIEADAIITLPSTVTFDLKTKLSRLTVESKTWDVIGKLESDASTTVWALRRSTARTVTAIPPPSTRRRTQ
jgi:hypothetical protein